MIVGRRGVSVRSGQPGDGGACRMGRRRFRPILSVRPVRIVVPFAAGGGVDVTGRRQSLRQGLTERLGQSVFVENRTGASGIIGTEFVASQRRTATRCWSAPQTTQAVVPAMYQDQLRRRARDFSPITVAATSPLMIVVHPSAAGEVGQGSDRAGQEPGPGQLTFGAASGGTPHMAGELVQAHGEGRYAVCAVQGRGTRRR